MQNRASRSPPSPAAGTAHRRLARARCRKDDDFPSCDSALLNLLREKIRLDQHTAGDESSKPTTLPQFLLERSVLVRGDATAPSVPRRFHRDLRIPDRCVTVRHGSDEIDPLDFDIDVCLFRRLYRDFPPGTLLRFVAPIVLPESAVTSAPANGARLARPQHQLAELELRFRIDVELHRLMVRCFQCNFV